MNANTTRDNATLLSHLIDASSRAIDKPLAVPDPDWLSRLRDDIAVAVRRPAEDRVIFDEDHLLAQAVAMHCQAIRGLERDRAQTLQQVIGVLLPKARNHFSKALEQRHMRPGSADR